MKAILVGVSTNYDRYDLDYSLDELKNQLKQDVNFVYENYVYKTVKSMVK